MPANPIFCAIDTPALDAAEHMAHQVAPHLGGLKLGLEFFAAQGPAGVRRIGALGAPIFLDLKLHDIPNTVAGTIRALTTLQPAFITLHASGGRAMLTAAAAAVREAAERLHVPRPKLLAVTVLTSLDADDLRAIGQDTAAHHQVDRLAFLARDCGVDGVVCSAREIAHLRGRFHRELLLMVPGIRPPWWGKDDQKRTTTPAEAMAAGADHLVIGRPITGSTDPAAAARRIVEELS